jgi:hypothetical protein
MIDGMRLTTLDCEADYLVSIPPAVLNSPFRCAKCRHAQAAHTRISDCCQTTTLLVGVALKQGHRLTPCPKCGGPLAHSKQAGVGGRCLRCEYRDHEADVSRRPAVFGSYPKCKGCGKQFVRPKRTPKATICRTCKKAV